MGRSNFIIVNTNSKGGLCCSYSIDLNIGCSNKCESCYGLKVSMMKREDFHTDNPVEKVFDEKKFIQSVKKYRNKGMGFARLGKFSDIVNGNYNGTLNQTLKAATKEGLRLVLISKSLVFNEELSKLLREGNHTLHMSCGLISQAQSNEKRICTYSRYKKDGVNSRLRIVEDITKRIPSTYKYVDKTDIIVTPLRFNSEKDLNIYEADKDCYSFQSGYYRLLTDKIHSDWGDFPYWCGESTNKDGSASIRCCSCLVNIGDKNVMENNN